jgi:hypothetical protein
MKHNKLRGRRLSDLGFVGLGAIGGVIAESSCLRYRACCSKTVDWVRGIQRAKLSRAHY